MKKRIKFTLLLLTIMIFPLFSVSASGSNTLTGSLTVNSGGLSIKFVSSDDINFGTFNLGNYNTKEDYKEKVTGKLGDIIVNDSRGSGEGFTISIKASKFSASDKGDLEAAYLSIQKSPTGSLASYFDTNMINKRFTTSNQIIATVNSANGTNGMGINELKFGNDSLELNVDLSKAYAGVTYNSTITITVSSYPL